MAGLFRDFYFRDRDASDPARYISWYLTTFGLVLLVVFVGAVLVAPFQPMLKTAPFLRFIGLALLVGTAGFAGGGFLGFLFGVPRMRTSESSAGEAAVLSNTNLEQVSDWLTKIVIGVTLVQFHAINGLLWDFRVEIDGAFPIPQGSGLVACLILGASAIAGFMGAYLKAKTDLMRAFDPLKTAKDSLNASVGQISFAAEARKLIQYPLLAAEPAASSAAASLLGSSLEPTTDPEMLRLTGLAQAVLKNFKGAADALGKAAASDPDPDLKILAARARAVGGDPKGALAQLPPEVPLTGEALSAQDFEAALARMFVDLYVDGGFVDAIKIGESLKSDPGGENSPRVWLYLASAYGQKHADLKRASASDADLKVVKAQALDAAKRALELDSRNNLPTLRTLWDVSDRTKPARQNDLESFADDPDFIALLQPPPPAPAPPASPSGTGAKR